MVLADIQVRNLLFNYMEYYIAVFPYIDDMGTVSSVTVSDKPMETKEEEALWHLNKSREHDNLKPLNRLPRGTKFKRFYREYK